MKNFKLYLAALLVVGFAGFAYADGHDLNFKSIQELPTLAAGSIASGDLIPVWDASANQFVSVDATAYPGASTFNGTTSTATTINAGSSGTAGTINVYPTTASSGKFVLQAIDNTGAYASTLKNTNIGQATVYSLPDCGNATCNLVTTKGTQTISGALTLSAASTALAVTNNATVGGTLGVTGVTTATGGLVSTATNDLSPTFSAGITANPVAMITHGTCTVAAVNGGTCIILTGVASRTITVTHFDIVAAGSASTCTGVLLEDNNGTPVVVATLAAATLTSAAHNVPLAATLGVGFGGGSGLTVAKSLQLIKNGSDCATTTAFTYSVTYAIQ